MSADHAHPIFPRLTFIFLNGRPMYPSDSAVISLALPLIREYEGFKSKPYLCAAGTPTIGYGTTRYPNGYKVSLKDLPIGPIEAERFLCASAGRVFNDLRPLLKREPGLHQAAALLSLAYNIGVGSHDGIKGDLADSTLLELFNAGDIKGAADQFLVWDKAHVNGKLVALPGLTRRRQSERALFLS
jgi:lysozyme